ncbi:hypothetical protein AQUCO_00900433v1 [Aquilegia coerulea]|uniref:Uncharacterized protein n=1 Tax=Aquilegia coerulea TaxID=218851 RepID=A0A2G5EDI6_AQUCA|nr:hypothetical protein AQUCO_00900433v1 [Aquilegia coerulea]
MQLNEDFDKDCLICKKPFTVVNWIITPDDIRRTEICHSCSQLENVCEVCGHLCRKGRHGFLPTRAADSEEDVQAIFSANKDYCKSIFAKDLSDYRTTVLDVHYIEPVGQQLPVIRQLHGDGRGHNLSRM